MPATKSAAKLELQRKRATAVLRAAGYKPKYDYWEMKRDRYRVVALFKDDVLELQQFRTDDDDTEIAVVSLFILQTTEAEWKSVLRAFGK